MTDTFSRLTYILYVLIYISNLNALEQINKKAFFYKSKNPSYRPYTQLWKTPNFPKHNQKILPFSLIYVQSFNKIEAMVQKLLYYKQTKYLQKLPAVLCS